MTKSLQYKRADRVAMELQKALGQMLIEGVIKDPRLQTVSFTNVKLSDDLRNAKVYYSQIGDEGQLKETERALKRSVGFIRSEVGHRLKLRYVPDIRFYFDASLERGARIAQLLEQAHVDEDETGESAEIEPDDD